ncbi:Protein kinase C-like, phorbol ester/diacylglycerol binding protein [Corchorus olitorius]|uniref:Protein kinase C-like, phorbol ester/diacylglycerol binding protein n=1 Tax=Corchorus olitorius TaxID=93759 RepID=A0A1R3G3E9_9ROSI|nr:Protein kinase C-like, phorbol ester/diacylglycerol binding protein [Corchorus olitorius]
MDSSVFFIILLSSLVLSIAEAFDANYPPLKCGHGALDISFPFRLKTHQPQHCGGDEQGFDLFCRDNSTMIHFPSYGDLVVKSISYDTRKLNLLDAKNCVHEVFLNLNLSLTPFHYYYVVKKYTYLNCSASLGPSVREIPCLSGSQHHVYTIESSAAMPDSCRPIKTVAIPFAYSSYLSDNSFGLGLTWEELPERDNSGFHSAGKTGNFSYISLPSLAHVLCANHSRHGSYSSSNADKHEDPIYQETGFTRRQGKSIFRGFTITTEMEGHIDHTLHEHPLTLIEEEEVNHELLCDACKKSLSTGPIYGCSRCPFYFHKACTELPRQIQHFFHPCPLSLYLSYAFTCNACFKMGKGFEYYCRECRFFSMHAECAQRPTIKSIGDGEEIIQHFTHWHPLRLNRKKGFQVGCGICEKLICFDSAYSTAAYGCEECKFYVHKSCMLNIPQQINNHFFHPSCSLILHTTPYSSYKCGGCNDEHVSGSLVFRCRIQCGFKLDVKCALLPTLDQSKDIADKIQYVGHKHPLVALDHNNNKDNNCIVSEVGYCKTCAVSVEAEIHHYFHPLHPLTLTFLKDRSHSYSQRHCGACLGLIDRLVLMYRCDKCSFNLHFDCAIKHKHTTRQLLVKYQGHSRSHPLTYFDKIRNDASCNICEKEARNCIFRCVACNFYMHLYCHPSAPKIITHKCHLHPLTLTQAPFDFELVSLEYREKFDQYCDAYDFYCDVCEEKRFKPESVYYCTECKFIAETSCVISELLPSFSGLEDQYPTGDDRANSRDDENSALEAYVAELKEKKRPLKSEIKKLEATLEALKVEMEPLSLKLKEAKKDFLMNIALLSNYKK